MPGVSGPRKRLVKLGRLNSVDRTGEPTLQIRNQDLSDQLFFWRGFRVVHIVLNEVVVPEWQFCLSNKLHNATRCASQIRIWSGQDKATIFAAFEFQIGNPLG